MNRLFAVLALTLLAAAPGLTQEPNPPMPNMPGMKMPATPKPKTDHQRSADTTMPGMSMATC